MKYVGNTALSAQIQERILNTFQQTLSLAEEGNRQEALLGCDFILRLDPLFEPARQLQQRLKEGDGAVDIEAFRLPAGGEADELPTSENGGTAVEEEEAPPAQAPADDGFPGRLAMLFEQRDYQELLQLAQERREEVVANAELRQLVDTATGRLEAEPYVRNFIDSARTAKDLGDLESAKNHLEKARELDPSHPGIADLEADLRATAPTGEAVAQPADVPAEPPIDLAEALELEAQSLIPLDSEPSARLDTESEERIRALLAEGQAAFEASQYQVAIDAWSRIFLIDIDHAEASRRIELARKLKAEVERQVEETFHEAVSLLESAKLDEARATLQKILEMQPGHLGAQEYLDKLESGDLTFKSGRRLETAPTAAPVPPALEEAAEELDELAPEAGTSAEEMPPPEPPPPSPVKAPTARKRSFALIGGAVLIAVLLIGWFVASKWDRIFPGPAIQETAATQPRVDPVDRARQLHDAGKTAMAINLLRRLPPGSEQYAEAQSLIAVWEGRGESDTTAAEVEPPQVDLARREALLTGAREAMAAKEHLRARELLDRAAAIQELSIEEKEIEILAHDMLEDLEDELRLFEQGDWEFALPNLWRMHEEDPQNRDVLRLMVDSYYNLGLRDLQRGDSKAASEKFEEALSLYPDDEDARRLAEFADAYERRPADLLFRIFVKYQHFR